MRSAPSTSLTLTRIAACTLTALALLSACGSKDAGQAGAGAPGAKMPAPQVGVIKTKFQQVALETELPARVEAIRVAEVRARVNGVVLKRLFTEGSIVK
ncbi:MAG: efflux transporter periplasmic adaptor subunit, partial [Telluria sp.]